MKKALKVILIFICLFLAGFGVGILFAVTGTENIVSVLSTLWNSPLTAQITLIIFIAFDIVMFCLCQINYAKARALEKILEKTDDDEADELYDQVENYLNFPIMFGNILMIGNMFLFSASIYLIDHNEWADKHSGLGFGIAIALFILGMIYTVLIQKLAIDEEKRLNPEKQGSIFDKNFQTEWLNSCDEAQKLAVYKASYSAYKSVNFLCSLLWLVAFFGLMFLDTGILSVLIVCIIWGTTNVVYCRTAIKLENGKLR